MRIKRKTEEKKMSMSKNIAHLAVTAGLTAALSFGGVMAPVTMAFAEGTPTVAESGSVTIKEDIYKDTAFKGIKIFSAKVTQDQKDDGTWDSTAEKTLSDIDWASGSVKSAVTTAFNNDETKPDGLPTGEDAESAQAWAQFIKKHGSDADEGKTSRPEACSTRSLLPLRRSTFPKALTVGQPLAVTALLVSWLLATGSS